ncbi:YdeI/OmpD-associated family protein [Edaphobacter sp. HDX4]|uniref:YdeI/OmpD-associated family protein n=1 Tax=Edaphobacter sp. HDX4 TaxID=2794064 RepID=UPI002FE6323B
MKTAGNFDPRVDAYINKSAPFAQPVLTHLRELVHKVLPDIEEDIKWSMPFFTYHGQMFGNLAAFKAHCSFGLFGAAMRDLLKKDGFDSDGMGSLGKIATARDLPTDKVLTGYIRQAAAFIDEGSKTMTRPRMAAKPAPEIPVELAAALKKNKVAQKVFDGFSVSCQREYTEWIAEAKRAETKEKRIVQAVEWIAEGKQRNWKYQNC